MVIFCTNRVFFAQKKRKVAQFLHKDFPDSFLAIPKMETTILKQKKERSR